jgi:HAD superfamily hydrolase (TIGR01549 family)
MHGSTIVLFDLDQTLVDSRSIEHLRRARQWQAVNSALPGIRVYAGIGELLQRLSSFAQLGVVTSAPRQYAQRIIRENRFPFPVIVGYGDTRRHKPHPDPLLRAASLISPMNGEAARHFYVGDDPKDIVAAASAGMQSIAALWGAISPGALVAAKPSAIAKSPADVMDIVQSYRRRA